MKASDYVRRNLRFTPYPHEPVGWIVEEAGPELCMFSSDYPHIEAGASATFTAAASANPAATVQWQVSTNGGTSYTNVSGATSTTLTVSGTTAAQNGSLYHAVFTNSIGSTTSNAATLTVNFAPAITTQPASSTVTAGQTATFTVVATGNPAPTYQWASAPSGSSTFTNISGATSATLTVASATAAQNGNQYRVTVTNSVGTVTSSIATLTVQTPPAITTQPSSATVTAGATATFTAAASGNPAPTVQWQVSTNGGTSFTPISGATSATLTLTGDDRRAERQPVRGRVHQRGWHHHDERRDADGQRAAGDHRRSRRAATVTAGSTADVHGRRHAVTRRRRCSGSRLRRGSSTFTNISGATSATLTVASTTAAQNGNQYRGRCSPTRLARRRRAPRR